MKKEKFLEILTEELELSKELQLNTNLKELEEWDSMAAMLLIGVVSNEFDTELNADDIQKIDTVQSLIERIGIDKFN